MSDPYYKISDIEVAMEELKKRTISEWVAVRKCPQNGNNLLFTIFDSEKNECTIRLFQKEGHMIPQVTETKRIMTKK